MYHTRPTPRGRAISHGEQHVLIHLVVASIHPPADLRRAALSEDGRVARDTQSNIEPVP